MSDETQNEVDLSQRGPLNVTGFQAKALLDLANALIAAEQSPEGARLVEEIEAEDAAAQAKAQRAARIERNRSEQMAALHEQRRAQLEAQAEETA